MAFSYDTGASPSRRRRQAWPALFVATSRCDRAHDRCEQVSNGWMNGRFDAYQHQAPSRQETNGCPRERAGEFFRLGMLGVVAEGVKLDDGTEAASSVVEG